jgi:hypothetical protein
MPMLFSTNFFFFLRFAKHFPTSFSLIFFSSVVAIISFDFHMVFKYLKNICVFILCNFFFLFAPCFSVDDIAI